jgi:hypothetical protein
MMWQRETQKPFLLDFEFICFGPGIQDICYFLFMLGSKIRRQFEDKVLHHYHEKLISSGKIDPASYPFDRMKADYIRFFVPRCAPIAFGLSLFLPREKAHKPCECLA